MKFKLSNPMKNRNAKNYKYDPCVNGVSQSMLAAWLDCREKSRLATLLGWTSVGASKPLTFGDLSHGALEMAYLDIRAKKATSLRTVVSRIPNYLAQAETRFWRQQVTSTLSMKDLVEESIAQLTMLLPLYFERWWKEDSQTTWLLVEDSFSVPVKVDNVIVPMVGKFDGVIEEKGKIGVFETKNKGQWSADLIDLLPMDLQLSYYIAALVKRGRKPTYAKYNLIRRPGERRKVEEPLKAFVERIGDNVRKDPGHYFERYEERLTPDEVARYVNRAHELVSAFYRWWRDTDHTTIDLCWNSGSCENKYGVCNYLPICSRNDHGGHRIREHVSPELAPTK